MVLRVLDVETTGTDPAADRIVEIAAVDLDQNGKIASMMQNLCNPQRTIPPQASAVHHIIDADVATAPPFSEIAHKYDGADIYIAHNAAFDRGFVEPTLGAKTWICTMKCALRIWPDAPGFSNQTLRYWRGHVTPFDHPRESVKPHGALSDAIVTGALFFDLLKAAEFSDLKRWSAEPALYTTFAFGKHRGQRFDAVDQSYLRWIVDKSDLDADTKFSARHWLNKAKETA